MPQQKQEKELLTLDQEKRKVAVPGGDTSLSLIALKKMPTGLETISKPQHYPGEVVAIELLKGLQQVSPSTSVPTDQEAESGSLQLQSRHCVLCLWDQASAVIAHGRAIKKHAPVSIGLPLPEPFSWAFLP